MALTFTSCDGSSNQEITEKPELTEAIEPAESASQEQSLDERIKSEVISYATGEDIKCDDVIEVNKGEFWTAESPKYEVTCDSGEKFIWAMLINGEVTISWLLYSGSHSDKGQVNYSSLLISMAS